MDNQQRSYSDIVCSSSIQEFSGNRVRCTQAVCESIWIKDAMHLLFIKEMDMVPQLMKIHPANVLVASADSLVSADVQITTQAAIAVNGWLTDKTQFEER